MLESSTIARNQAAAARFSGSDPFVTAGGGLLNAPGGTARLSSTLVADNAVPGAPLNGPDCAGTFASRGSNLIQNLTDCTLTGDLTGNRIGLDPRLGPLSDNGGPTQTQALLTGSPAIGAAGTRQCPRRDQRGIPRPQDGDGNSVPVCDIGAFELAP